MLSIFDLERQFQPAILNKIDEPMFKQQQIELWLKRDDLLHPIISGNKWRKLKYILAEVIALGKDTIVSMGGAYSNHLHALAYACRMLNLNCRTFIRGEQPNQLNPTLTDLCNWNVQIEFISREHYRMLRTYRQADSLPHLKSHEYWLPEGGALQLALQGVAEMVAEIDIAYNVICCACGTGTTLAGIISAAPKNVQVLGFAALKGAFFLNAEVKAILPPTHSYPDWQINVDYHCGGFAKTTPELLDFISYFTQRHNIPLEYVYTGKMLFGLYGLIRQGYFQPGQKIVAIHSGGLQGIRNLSSG